MWYVTRKAMLIMSALVAVAFPLFLASSAGAHCDTMDGPVVKDAQKALETGNVNLVLAWVKKDDEAQIKEAFNKALAVRKLSPDAKEMADNYFFETLVRVHREGEGAPYTGLKPSGTPIEPGLAAADKAIESGSTDQLVKHLNSSVQEGVAKHFSELQAKKNYDKNDVAAGRKYVASYVTFIHYVEDLSQAAEGATGEHDGEAKAAPGQEH